MSTAIALAALVALLVIGAIGVLFWLDERPTKREQIRQEQLEAEGRITAATYAALHRMYEEARRGSSSWGSGPGSRRP